MHEVCYGGMGCHGSRNAEKVVKHSDDAKINGPRLSTCNGRITRLIQDDQDDYCTDENSKINIKLRQFAQDDYATNRFLNCKKYRKWQIYGKWVCGLSSGGSRNNVELFATNPQFQLELGNYKASTQLKKESIIVSLKQNNFETQASYMAFFIYKNENPGKSLNAENFLCESAIFESTPFIKRETITAKLNLSPDLYVIIPAMFHPHCDNDFTLTITILRDVPTNVHQLKVENESIIYFRFQ